LSLILSLALAACLADQRPLAPPGGGGGGDEEPGHDAAQPSDGGAIKKSGVLCHVDDLRTPGLCAPGIDLSGLTIESFESTDTTESNADGSFELTVPEGLSIVRAADKSAAYRESIVPISSSLALEIPVVPASDWETLLSLASASESPETAALALYLKDQNDFAVKGATATAPAGTIYLPFYDGPSGVDWAEDTTTGDYGAILLLGVPTADETVAVDINVGGSMIRAQDIPVHPGGITFVTLTVQ
jgi:hypothetical protein